MRIDRVKGVWAAALSLAAAAGLAGCIPDMETEVLVKKDGSGQIIKTAGVPDMGPMLAMMGQTPTAEQTEAMHKQFAENAKKEAEAIAQAIEGGKVESAELVPGEEGKPAQIKSVVSFPDVNKINLGAVMGNPTAAGADDKGAIKFENGVLTVANLALKSFGEGLGDMASTEEQKAQMRQMLPMMQDSTVRFTIRVEGRIAETNAAYKGKGGDAVLLASIPVKKVLDATLNKSDDLAKAVKLETPAERAKALEALVEGLKLESADPVTIKF